MAVAALIRPDTDFLKSVLASGGSDLKKCFQCATCSAVCQLSLDDDPFPRRQMIEAQWGLKERLLRDPALWLCHNCGQCTTHCPRGARPGDVLGALRQEAIKYFAFPGFLGKLVASPKAWPVLFLIPALIFAAILQWAPKGLVTEDLEFANRFPIPTLEALFFVVTGLVVLAFVIGLTRFIGAVKTPGSESILPGFLPALALAANHERFATCGDNRGRFWGHLLTMWGFLGLAFMGTVVGIGTMLGVLHTPLQSLHPLKIFANLCAIVILAGFSILFVERVKDPAKRAASTYFDWFFLLTLGGVVITGLTSEILRWLQLSVMYAVYFVHLVLILSLFLCAPYSKFAHLLYRTVAIAARKAEEKRPKAPEIVPGALRAASCAYCPPSPSPAEGQEERPAVRILQRGI